jgi:hypothetical protein
MVVGYLISQHISVNSFRFMRTIFSLLLFVSLVSCNAIRVLPVESAPGVNWQEKKTFGFYQVQASGDTITAQFAEGIADLQQAIAAELKQRGYEQSTDRPDWLINIGIVVNTQVQTRQTDFRTDGAPRYIGQRNYSWKSETVELGRYREGTVSVHVVDAARRELIWKGAVQGVIPDKTSARMAAAATAMRMLMERFPGRVN